MTKRGKIRLLPLRGTPYELGFQHGTAYRDEILSQTEARVKLCSDPKWAGHSIERSRVLEIAEACLDAHRAYSPELVEELRGMSDATGLSLAELLIVNGFTDFVDTLYAIGGPSPKEDVNVSDNCTTFIVPDSATNDGHGFYGQTWDMHVTAEPNVVMLQLHPEGKPKAVIFSITGCVGMIGLNDAGIAVGINTLSGGDGKIGVTWPFVVRRILAQTNIESALACLTTAELAGAHNYMIFDKNGRGYNIEAMSTTQQVTPLEVDSLVHTNHCVAPVTRSVERVRPAELQENSLMRLAQASELLSKRPLDEHDLMALTRHPDSICRVSAPPYYIQTCGAAIMRPATGEMWAVWGVPSENEYEKFTI